jgi:hypothetical protein
LYSESFIESLRKQHYDDKVFAKVREEKEKARKRLVAFLRNGRRRHVGLSVGRFYLAVCLSPPGSGLADMDSCSDNQAKMTSKECKLSSCRPALAPVFDFCPRVYSVDKRPTLLQLPLIGAFSCHAVLPYPNPLLDRGDSGKLILIILYRYARTKYGGGR